MSIQPLTITPLLSSMITAITTPESITINQDQPARKIAILRREWVALRTLVTRIEDAVEAHEREALHVLHCGPAKEVHAANVAFGLPPVITEPADAILLAEEDYQWFRRYVHKRNQEAGYITAAPSICPAACARDLLRETEDAILQLTSPIAPGDIPEDMREDFLALALEGV